MKTFAFLWNENEAMKGSCEIATAVSEFLLVKSNDSAKIIYLFCDRCGGQNKNRMINVTLLSSLVEFNLGKIELIILCSEHSQNENNTAQLVIKRQSRSQFIYTTTSQQEKTTNQALTSNVCSVKVLTHDDIIDFQSNKAFPEYAEVLEDKCYQNGNDKKFKVMWSEIKQVKFSTENPNNMHYKYQYEEEYRSCRFPSDLPKQEVLFLHLTEESMKSLQELPKQKS